MKEGHTGLKSTSSLSQVMSVTTHRDQKRKDKTLKKSYREEASTPVKPDPILRNLYHLLPTKVLVMLEEDCARLDRFQVYSVRRPPAGVKPTIALITTRAGRYGLAPRKRTIRLHRPLGVPVDDPVRVLVCDCKHFNRYPPSQTGFNQANLIQCHPSPSSPPPLPPLPPLPSAPLRSPPLLPSSPLPPLPSPPQPRRWLLPCAHILWIYRQLNEPYPLEGIHFRWLLYLCKDPERTPIRTARDGTQGPPMLPTTLDRLLAKEEARLLAEKGHIPFIPSDGLRDERGPSAERQPTAESKRNAELEVVVSRIRDLDKTTARVHQFLIEQLAAIADEAELLLKDDHGDTPINKVHEGRRSQKRYGRF